MIIIMENRINNSGTVNSGMDIFPELRTYFRLSFFNIFLNGGGFKYKVIYMYDIKNLISLASFWDSWRQKYESHGESEFKITQ